MQKLFLLALALMLSGCSRYFLKYHGQEYKVIQAGDQYWMAENLATRFYRNGQEIPFVESPDVWKDIETPACGYYKNDPALLLKYGMLYNWYAVETGKLCPLGWHAASNDDWLILESYLGGHLRAGGKMKSVAGWEGKHLSADDIKFNALPGGYRLNEDFMEGYAAIFWSSTAVDGQWIWGRRIDYNSAELLNTFNNRQNGFSVRCVSNRKANDRK